MVTGFTNQERTTKETTFVFMKQPEVNAAS